MKQTKTIDNIECPSCGCEFDGAEAINYDISNSHTVSCPRCSRKMSVDVSVEYLATLYKKDGE